jgi:type II secretory pathway component PulF
MANTLSLHDALPICKNMTGTMPAPDESALEEKLKGAGLWLVESKLDRPGEAVRAAPRAAGQGVKLSGKRGRRELIDFCTLMTFQLRVGVPLVRALDVACQDCKDLQFQNVLRGLQSQIESGMQLHEAMERYPNVFSLHFISVVKAGETSSKLPEIFNDLKLYLEWVEQIVNDVRQASLYPSIVLVVIMGFAIFLFTFVIPKFAELLTKLNAEQPLLTQIVFGAGDFAKATWWIWVPLFLLLVIGIPIGRRTSKGFAYKMDQLKLNLPVFGELNLMLALSRFAHNLAILYRSGIPILACLKYCTEGLIGNAVVEQAVAAVEEDVKRGSTISEAMHRQPVFSAMLKRMITMGETTGNLDKALDTVADYYNDVIPRTIKKVFSIMEPMLMLTLIFVVGCVALAIYLPIISLMGSIKG